MARRLRGQVLILDNDVDVCEFLSRAVAEAGFGYVVCHGADGLGELQGAGTRFDLIVTNLAPNDVSLDATLAPLTRLFPGIPILHLHEVIPFSVERFIESVWRRMQRPTQRPA